ncbi:hypothetical protein ACX9NE_19995 [Mycobacterium sp. ML4]
MRSLADQAEAEAAEAEALAAAARARARAIKLRREAGLADAGAAAEADTVVAPAEANGPPAPVEAVAGGETEEREPAEGSPVAETEPKAAEAETAGADDGTPKIAVSEPDRRWPAIPKWSSVAAVVAVVVSLVAVGAGVEMAMLHKQAVRERQQVAEYAAAARQGVVTLTSLDFEHAKEGVKNILDVSTGTFKDDFLKMAEDFTNVVEQSKVVSQGSVQATAVELDSMTDNSAVVLVSSTSEVTNAAGAKQDPRKYRLIVTVTRDGGQLKMSKVEFVP